MAVTIGSNIASLRTQRQLDRGSERLNTVFERLSSGQRINRASDDAAGLAIADSLRANSRIATVSIRNANDAISAVNIMTSAISNQKGILFRMAELAEQSANGVYSYEQRQSLQVEYGALLKEFDRIADSTTFNDLNLMRNRDGESVQIQVGLNGSTTSLLQIESVNSHAFSGVYNFGSDLDESGQVDPGDFGPGSVGLSGGPDQSYTDLEKSQAPGYAIFGITDSLGGNRTIRVNMNGIANDFLQLPPALGPLSQVSFVALDEASGDSSLLPNIAYPFANDAVTLGFNFSDTGATGELTIDMSGLEIQRRELVENIQPTNIGFTNVEHDFSARKAIDTIRNRIGEMAKLEGNFGAFQSRLETSIANMTVSRENFLAAESRIRDADIALESAELARLNILQQAAASVLAQANTQPQLSLQLLSG